MVAELEMRGGEKNSFPKWWDLSTIPRKSQLFHEKRVNEVFNLHFFLDFLPTSPSLSSHESNMFIIYYKKWCIISYGLKTVQQPGSQDSKRTHKGWFIASALWSWEEEQRSRDQSHSESIDESTWASPNMEYSSHNNSGFWNLNLQITNQII